MTPIFPTVLLLFAIVGFLSYKFCTRNFSYWEQRNVPYIKPIPLFGNYFDVMTFRIPVGNFFARLYNQFKTPYFGIFLLNTPILVVKSTELLKEILVRDFNYFYDRTSVSDKTCDSLVSKLLFFLKNPEWRIIRTKMTPIFTTGKMKGMLGLVNDASHEMLDYIKKHASKNSIEAKELCAKYTTDAIATCAFGIKAGSFEREEAEFRSIGRKMFDFSLLNAFRQVSYFMIPNVVKLFKLRYFKPGVNEFLRNTFWKTIELRESTHIKRNDLIDILIQMTKQPNDNVDFTGERVVAQAVMFFVAGAETTSTALAFALHELCLAPDIQNRAREEIKEVMEKHGSFTYEAVLDLKYLHMIIYETLRKYPVLPFLDRICMKDYKLPGSDLIIQKGTPVYVPIVGIHYDSKIFPEPEKFNPERFSEENRNSLPPFSFLAFGAGPRNCVGKRFALMVSKLGLARILLEYELERSSDTVVPAIIEPKSLGLAPRGGLPIKFKKINSDAADM